MDIGEIVKSIETKANMDLSVFREPRGIIRVLQLVIGTLAGIAIYGFSGVETIQYCSKDSPFSVELVYSYPFELTTVKENISCNGHTGTISLASMDSFSQYAEYFFIICLLSILYCFVIMFIYSKCTQTYETSSKYPVFDFVGTVIIAVLWLFASAAWTHGLFALKSVTDPVYLKQQLEVQFKDFNIIKVSTPGYFGLNVSAILGSLCFFLWGSDLWFLYKETPWFVGGLGSQAVDSPA